MFSRTHRHMQIKEVKNKKNTENQRRRQVPDFWLHVVKYKSTTAKQEQENGENKSKNMILTIVIGF